MKRFTPFMITAALLCGCTHTRVTKTADGYQVSRWTFLTNQSLSNLDVQGGGDSVKLGKATTEPADMAAAIASAAIKAAIK